MLKDRGEAHLLRELLLRSEEMSPQGPVGARLANFWRIWAGLGAEPWVVEVLREGYQVPFVSAPPLSDTPVKMVAYRPGSEKFQVLQSEVQAMVEKEAVELVKEKTNGFYNRLFVVTKASGGWRPVLDVSRLNVFVDLTPFSMESPRSVMGAIQPGDWMFSIDMKDAYFHVPIHPDSRKYLRFVFEDRVFQFRALCFGLSSAPQVFTRVLAPLARWLHLLGIRILLYLDDWLILANSLVEALRARQIVLDLAKCLGLIINLDKSVLTPSQTATYLGMTFDSVRFTVAPSLKRASNMASLVLEFLRHDVRSAQRWQVLLGHMISLEKFRPLSRLRLRHFQFWLNRRWDRDIDQDVALIEVPPFLKEVLPWWAQVDVWLEGVSLRASDPDFIIFSDASNVGWGAVMGSQEASGLWSPEEASLHINSLELRAMWLALQHWEDLLRSRTVALCGDNTTALAYVRNQGGTRSESLFLLAEQVLLWAAERKIVLLTQFVKGQNNVLADQLSRGSQSQPTEWTLSLEVCHLLWTLWGTPLIDLFASRRNARLPLFCSPVLDQEAWAVDAMLQRWDGLFVYAFPPYAMVRSVLNKLKRSRGTTMILVAPWWPQREWFPDLFSLSLDHPRLLPQVPDLLSQPHSGEHHHGLRTLALTAWRLSSDCLGMQVSPEPLPLQ